MAGYSGTPLNKKLGLKEGLVMYTVNSPSDYFNWLSPLPAHLIVKDKLLGELDFIHLFVKERQLFEKQFIKCKEHLKKTGTLWVSWPKRSSKVQTDLDENVIRDFGLEAGLVDVKVCAIDDIWSALKFMFRVKDR